MRGGLQHGAGAYSYYDGPLYEVERASDGRSTWIYPLSAGGYVDASQQGSWCSGTTCTITEIFDQSPECGRG